MTHNAPINLKKKYQESQDLKKNKVWKRVLNLQDAVAITSVAKIFETKVSFTFGKLVSEGFLELGTRRTHETINQIPVLLYSAFTILSFLSVFKSSKSSSPTKWVIQFYRGSNGGDFEFWIVFGLNVSFISKACL